MAVWMRTFVGIRDHFPARAPEWLMLIPGVGMGAALRLQPDMFARSPSFANLAAWGDEMSWSLAITVCCAVRLLALTVNGTFRAFRYSPHFRVLSAVVSGLFWSRFCLGILLVALDGAAPWSGVVAYGTFVVIELWNLCRSSMDIGQWVRERRNAPLG